MKKYYSISDIASIFKIPPHQLRYLEKSMPKFVAIKVRGRRYYTQQNIEILKAHFANNPKQLSLNFAPKINDTIDNLIAKFNCISNNILQLIR